MIQSDDKFDVISTGTKKMDQFENVGARTRRKVAVSGTSTD